MKKVEFDVNFLVGVCGMPQAGSTLCFNIVRSLLELTDYKIGIAMGNTLFPFRNQKDLPKQKTAFIYKQHILPMVFDTVKNPSMKFVVNVRRDLRDSVASNIRKDPNFLNGNVLDIANRNVKMYQHNVRHQNFDWCYEDYKANPVDYTMMMYFSMTGQGISRNIIADIVAECENIQNLDLPQDHETKEQNNHPHFQKTLMCKKHITNNKGKIGGYKKTLTKEQISLIENTYEKWLKDKGYLK